MTEERRKSFWETLPGILTGIAGLLGAIAALIVIWRSDAPKETTSNVSNTLAVPVPASVLGTDDPSITVQTYPGEPAPVPFGSQSPTQTPIQQPQSYPTEPTSTDNIQGNLN